KRRLEASLNPRVKVKYTGRGGSGNIRAASVAQSIPFDISADPDDDYEQIVRQGAQKAKQDKTPSTGRGGLGNFNRPRSKSFIAANAASKSKKEKPRRRRSTTSSRFSTSTTSTSEHHELHRISTDTASLSLSIPPMISTPTSSSSSPVRPSLLRLPTSPSRHSLPTPQSASDHYSLPTRMAISAASAPSLPLPPIPRQTSSLHLRVPTTVVSVSAPSSPVYRSPQSASSLFSLNRGSASSLGLPSPPASPISPDTSPTFLGLRTPPGLEKRLSDSRRDSSDASNADSVRGSPAPAPHKLHKAKSHDTTKWWKMGGRRRVKESVTVPGQDVAPDECAVPVPARDVAPAGNTASAQDISPDTPDVHIQETMAHLEEVGMHAMEVRMRMREERPSVRNNGRHERHRESDQTVESVVIDDGEHELVAERDTYPLPSVPEEEAEYVSFLDFS
ncbi:hypothetical protein JB92DRAFT_2867715, partial [Gautieria morchelliformis]